METEIVYVYQMGKVGSSSIRHSLNNILNIPVYQVHYFKGKFPYNKNSKIISLVREPIERNFSGFFQNFERVVGIPFAKSKYSIQELLDIFLDKYIHDVPLVWYDDEFYPNTGIDVYSKKFKDGFSIIDNCLFLRCELDDKRKSQLISKFLGINEFEIVRTGLSASATYGEMHKKFVKEVKFPRSYLDLFLGTKFVNHFYSDEYLLQKWEGRVI